MARRSPAPPTAPKSGPTALTKYAMVMSARCAGRSVPATTIRHGQPSYTQAVTAELRIATATLRSVQDDRVIRGDMTQVDREGRRHRGTRIGVSAQTTSADLWAELSQHEYGAGHVGRAEVRASTSAAELVMAWRASPSVARRR